MTDQSDAEIEPPPEKGPTEGTEHIRRYWWVAPVFLGCYSMYPYYSEFPVNFNVVGTVGYVYGIYPWLLAHPVRFIGSFPMLLTLVLWQSGWQPHSKSSDNG